MKAKNQNPENQAVETGANVETTAAKVVEKIPTGKKLENGDVHVEKADVIKVNAQKSKTYGLEKFHHIAKLKNGTGLVFIWDTREIVGVVKADAISADDINKNVRDSGTDLKITANTPAEALKAIESIQ